MCAIYGTLTGTTTPGQGGPGSNGSKGEQHISQRSRSGVSPSDCLMSYSRRLLEGGCYLSGVIQSGYSTGLVNWELG